MSKKLEGTPSWPKVEAARAAIAKHRAAGDRAALAAAQRALGEAFSACRAEAEKTPTTPSSPTETDTEPGSTEPDTEPSEPTEETTKVEKPPKKQGGGKKAPKSPRGKK
jgi:hypothetical protein